MPDRIYSDDDLRRAIAVSRSWRGVLRDLGLPATSAGARRAVQMHSERLGIDHAHFTGQRRWSEEALRAAIVDSHSWQQVLDKLGLSTVSSSAAFKGHALRLGIDTTHLGQPQREHRETEAGLRPDTVNLARAGSMLASAWFTLCGWTVSWPLEPCRFDVLASRGSDCWRIQVKTSSRKRGDLSMVSLTTSGHPTGGDHRRTAYDPDDIDYFFVIDRELNYYLIPIAVVGGLSTISLTAYQRFRVSQPLVQPT
jgi:PD-(D/E)XK endonuclease